jgi:hypothetical protein
MQQRRARREVAPFFIRANSPRISPLIHPQPAPRQVDNPGVGGDDESRPRRQDLLKGTSVNALLLWIADNPAAVFFIIAVGVAIVASRFPRDEHWMDCMR